MTSKDKYKENLVRSLDEMNLQQNLPHGDKPYLEVLLTQSPESIEMTQFVIKFETDEIFDRMDHKDCEKILALYIDFRKTFDKVTHQKLISKLGDMGFGRKLLKLLASYLKNQQQRVKIGHQKTEKSKVNSGEPQGSFLGPLIFIMYMSTLPNCIQRTPAFGYADVFKVMTSSIQEADQATKSIQQWSNKNDMVLNLIKSKILSMSVETATTEKIIVSKS
ncbi:uncharacterized protein LOC142345020 [Convolutriloba macropyga]|uniref:uncharacterized protein LOC142345020 n=1 Tax=Convolutriloba macropyga TaxID=536237 RepID=UPI003F5255DE